MGLWANLLQILAHTGLQTVSNIGTGYLTKGWAQEGALKNWLAQQVYEGAAGGGPEVQLPAQQFIKQAGGGEIPMIDKLKTIIGTGPGGEQALLGQGRSSEGKLLSFNPTSLRPADAPLADVDTAKFLLTPAPKLEQQAAEQVRGEGIKPLKALGYLKRTERQDSTTTALMKIINDPNQPEEMRLGAFNKLSGGYVLGKDKFTAQFGPGGTEQRKVATGEKAAEIGAQTLQKVKIPVAEAQIVRWQDMTNLDKKNHIQTSIQSAQKLGMEQTRAAISAAGSLSMLLSQGANKNIEEQKRLKDIINGAGMSVPLSARIAQYYQAANTPNINMDGLINDAKKEGIYDVLKQFGVLQ